jgi:hypothetical protein
MRKKDGRVPSRTRNFSNSYTKAGINECELGNEAESEIRMRLSRTCLPGYGILDINL